MNDKEFKKLLKKYGPKQMLSFEINERIKLTAKQLKILMEENNGK